MTGSPRTAERRSPHPCGGVPPEPEPVSAELERWLASEGDKTLGGLVAVFEERSFAILFVLLLGVPALPVPTGGATHVFEIVAVLLAAQLVVGRREVWLPRRWIALELAGERRERFLAVLLRMIRRLERISRPRLTFLFGGRAGNAAFGLLVIGGSAAAFLAPPFSGLDTLPALGVVLLSLAVLLRDAILAAVGVAIGVAGVALAILLGSAALDAIRHLI